MRLADAEFDEGGVRGVLPASDALEGPAEDGCDVGLGVGLAGLPGFLEVPGTERFVEGADQFFGREALAAVTG